MNDFLKNLFGKPYTIGELMKIDQGRQARAAGCTVSLVDTFYTLQEETPLAKFKSLFTKNTIRTFYITLKFVVKSDTGNGHEVFVQIDPDFSMTDWQNNRIKIYCDCADFMYRSAYILDKRDSIFANNSIKARLGAALTDIPKGKKGVTLLCKHSYAVVLWLSNNYNKIMKDL